MNDSYSAVQQQSEQTETLVNTCNPLLHFSNLLFFFIINPNPLDH